MDKIIKSIAEELIDIIDNIECTLNIINKNIDNNNIVMTIDKCTDIVVDELQKKYGVLVMYSDDEICDLYVDAMLDCTIVFQDGNFILYDSFDLYDGHSCEYIDINVTKNKLLEVMG